jgi:hypothetical protein
MWNAVTEDRREKQLFSKSLLVDEVNPSVEALYKAEEMYVTESAVKVRAPSHSISVIALLSRNSDGCRHPKGEICCRNCEPVIEKVR